MKRFFLIFITGVIVVANCNAQLIIDKGIKDEKIRVDGNRILFGKSPVLSLSASDLKIEDNTSSVVSFDTWNDLTQDKYSGQFRISQYGENTFHVIVDMKVDPLVSLKELSLKFDFFPDNPEVWNDSRNDFHWIPNIKSKPEQIASDHVFRSPSVMMMSGKTGVALIPDIAVLSENRPAPHYLDMRFGEDKAPVIIYGIANYKVDGHVYYTRSGDAYSVKDGKLKMGFYLIIDQETSSNELVSQVNRLLWKETGHDYMAKIEPQTVPFEKYADYGFEMALNNIWIKGVYPNSGGITLATYFDKETQKYGGRTFPMDLWFHSWFNNMRTAYGLYLWGEKSGKPEWKQRALEVKNLLLNAPADKGFFKTLYNSQTGTWVSSGQGGGEKVYHIPDNAWTAYWLIRFNEECENDPRISEFTLNFVKGLLSIQKPDGSFPTRIFVENLEPDPVLNGSASEGLAIWFLAEMRLRGLIPENDKKKVDEAIQNGLDHLRRESLPRQKFEDFELYFSCSRKPLDFYDNVSEMYGQNTLAIQWCAEAFRTGYQLFKREADLQNAIYCADILCLYQQVWNPDYLNFHAFGGFGVMNTDAEWNDARQAQFAETLANFYDLTGKIEYLERAVAAARASFALMIIDENKEVAPMNYLPSKGLNIFGAMAENYGHCGTDCKSGQSGFHWGTGSALCTGIILHNRYGDVFIDPELKHVAGINGITVKNYEIKKNKISLELDRLPKDDGSYSGKIIRTRPASTRLKINNQPVPVDDQNKFRISQ